MVNQVRTIDFLPEIFRTHTNRQFLEGSLDVLTSQPNLKRVQGFIGDKYGYGVEPGDKYVVEPTKTRSDYQLNPSVVFLKEDTQTAQDFISYPGIVSAIKHYGGNVDNHDRLFNNEFYSWDPFIDYDMVVNYAEYYWIPHGPSAIPVYNTLVYSTGEYIVLGDDGGYTFNSAPGINPTITLLRGGTYTFNVGAEFSEFWIQTVPGVNATTAQRTIAGVTGNGTNGGTITFVVPDKTTLVNDILYYQSATDPNSVGILQLIESNVDNYIDVDTVIGRKNYTSPNGITFTNGLKIEFDQYAQPSSYANNQYYVSGVGSAIALLPVDQYLAVERTGVAVDTTTINPWDIAALADEVYVPYNPEYITINRESRDYNAWTRSNRWFHEDVINTTQAALGYVTNIPDNTVTRAQRPILQYRGNLKLFNFGRSFLGFINILDTSTTDAFTDIEGKTLAQIGQLDGLTLWDGLRIVFAIDSNPAVRQNVYIVRLVPSLDPLQPVVNLVPDTTVTVRDGSSVTVYYYTGVNQAGATWYFNLEDTSWRQGQVKTLINQYPLYDIFDKNGVSLSSNSLYSGSSFNGTKLFSYTIGDGPDDPVLGFPIQYSNFESIGDILFTVNLNSDTFTYSVGEDVFTQNINIGFVHNYVTEDIYENLSGWVTAAGESFQYQVFEFPIIEGLNYSSSNTTITVDLGGTGYQPGDKLKISGNLIGGSTPENDLYFTVLTAGGGALQAIDTSSLSGTTVTVNETFSSVPVQAVTGVGTSAKVSVLITNPGTTTFKCDVLAKTTPDETPWNPVIVYYNDNLLDDTQFTVVRNTVDRTTEITVDSAIGVKVTALVISSDVSSTAYWKLPSNLENNPFNTNVTSVAVGDLKNQLATIFSNIPGATGKVLGNNNLRDLGNINKWGTAIAQNSASLVLPGLFLRKPEVNIFNSLQFNSDQYQIYKTLLVDLAESSDYNIYISASNILDDIIYQISTTKNQSSAFFHTDMIFSGTPYITNTYSFSGNTTTATFSLSTEVWSDNLYSTASYRGIAVYLTRVVQSKSTTVQLLKGVDYVVSSTPGVPSVTVNYNIQPGDTITVKEYNQTYGSYCPSTPSKLGLYPIFIPEVYLIPGNTTGYIRGHDGSLNKLYGTYTIDNATGIGIFSDFRDQVLFEFEYRVYNNYKVSGPVPLQEDDVFPGQGRTTGYSNTEILDIYSPTFLNWVGANRLDYRAQLYNQTNKFTYNYNQSSNKATGDRIEQGGWRGLYQWLYDSFDPANAPWELLGFVDKPSWWAGRYGVAPYTSGNTYMWGEIAQGYVWNDGDPYINPKRIRPYLLDLLPVDSYGNLQNPFVAVVGNYDQLTFNNNWVVGDGGPVEAGFWTSSAWPYALMRILALTKPAKFFNLFADRDLYKYNSSLLTPGQYLYDNRYHLNPTTLVVNGSGNAKHSYINWVVEYNNQRGANGTNVVTTLLRNLDVRLTYNMAGFSAKNYLKFLVEKATPTSRNNSLLIPDENYAVLLYDNPAQERIIYSSVVVQRTTNGWTVWGNSKTTNYFTTLVPKEGLFKKVTVNGFSVRVAENFYQGKTVNIPYGTLLYSPQSVAQFLLNYGGFLTEQGVEFTNIEDGVEYNWVRMVEEFLAWSQNNWGAGSIIALNPSSRNFRINRPGLVPQPLTLQGENFLLNENLLPIQNSDMCIDRQAELLDIKVLSPADTVGYANINLNSIEHAIVFDNFTSFGDTIYNIQTGLRQGRLLLQGYKTGDWVGYINTSGFILNENNVQEWQPNTKYPKNIIVIFKNKYYTARELIEPAAEFFQEDWLETDYGQIKSGLLPNPSTEAYEALFYYDTTRANLENDADLLSFSLIGFRPREYMAAADLSDITQINVYKNIIKGKGTKQLADSFRGAKFDQGSIDYLIQENWAIKNGEFGSILNTNFVEARLVQQQLTGNPTMIGFAAPGGVVAGVQQSVPINELINWSRPPLTPNFLPLKAGSYTLENGIPSAGYVNTGDSKFQKYTFADLNVGNAIDTLYSGNNVWVANYKNDWDIYTAEPLGNQVVELQNNFNGTVQITFRGIHGLSAGNLISIINFDPRVNGFYEVKSVGGLYTITIELSLDVSVKKISASGTGFKLTSRRFEQASDAANSVIPYTEWSQRKIWVDLGQNSQWAVWGADVNYRQSAYTVEPLTYGLGVAYTAEIGRLVVDGAGKLYRYGIDGTNQIITGSGLGAGTQVRAYGIWAYVSSPTEGKIYVYQLNVGANNLDLHQVINATANIGQITGAIAVSSDAQWLYVADSVSQTVAVYSQNNITTFYSFVTNLVDPAVPALSGWGTSLATSTDGIKLVVGAPNETISGQQNAGAVYVYSRRVQRFYGNGVTTVFTLANAAPANIADVYINNLLLTNSFSVNGTQVTVFYVDPNVPDPECNPAALVPPPDGSIITVSTGFIQFVQKFTSAAPNLGALYGLNVDTNRYGAEVIVGCPYEISTVDNIKGVEGAVYRYTNGGQRYGVVNATVTGSHTGTIFVDGWIVNYSGNIDSISNAINSQTPTNITASVSGSTLIITVLDMTPEVVYNIIDITGSYTDLTSIGIVSYTNTQVLKNFNKTNTSAWGYNVKMDERDSLLITALTDKYRSPTTFDYTPDCIENDTIFDAGTTTFVDTFTEQGVVYMYDYLPAYNEGLSNPGKYAFGQYIDTPNIVKGTPNPKFGFSLSYASNIVTVGAPYWSTSGGGVATYTTTWVPEYSCQINRPTSWWIDKVPLPVVDINGISNISIYNGTNNETLDWLDYCDPVQGKVLGAVATNVDYMSEADPAVYTLDGSKWTVDHVGQTWLDLKTIRMLNYHQPNIEYNAKNWGKAFPGSTADILTWVESTVAPVSYGGPGYPISFDLYTTAVSVDDSTNSLVTKYYFWVNGYTGIPAGKTLSPEVLSAYLLNPLDSGISYLAPITLNVVALYNSGGSIQADSSVLHLGYGIPDGIDDTHTSWSLIREGDPEDFLSGLPSVLGVNPTGLYQKFIDSFAGWDELGIRVPDPRLPELVRYGTAVRPAQSMFINRETALQNYISYANRILIELPIVEMRDLSFLQKTGITYNTNNFWEYVNWWAEGYNNETKAVLEVDNINDLQIITENQLLVSIAGTNIFLEDGIIAKVAVNSFGRSEYYIYSSGAINKWTRIGAENTTIQILPALYGPYGWASEPWGLVWDKDLSQETRWIIRWLNEQCYINELSIERNRSLILMFKYIQTESLQDNNYLPWLNKTSLIDVNHRIRSLLPYKKYQRDNQEFLQGFLNEIKPYHVLIKDFIYSYDGLDTYAGNLTDFDLPAEWNSGLSEFITPKIVYGNPVEDNEYNSSNIIWDSNNYKEWGNNYGLYLSGGTTPYNGTQLAAAITNVSTTAVVKSTYGLPAIGTIRIGQEDITYDGVDLSTNTIFGLTRGVNGTTAAGHSAGAVVYFTITPVIVYNTGRGYLEPPKITAYIDTAIWPQPRIEAVFEPVLAAGELVGITVVNPGSGYAVQPQLVIPSSSISESFSSSDIDSINNTITITGHSFVSGDPLVYRPGAGTSPAGLTPGAYYYVRSLDANTIALYETYESAVISLASPYLHISSSDGRVAFIDSGSGSSHTLAVTARAEIYTAGLPVRSMTVKVKFDRLSYTLDEGAGSAVGRIDAFYRPTLDMPGKSLPQLMTGVEYPNATFLGDNFRDRWDWTNYDIFDWDGILNDPPTETNLVGPTFTSVTPTTYDAEGDPFPDGYTPEELVGEYVSDSVVITVTSTDIVPYWIFTVTIDQYGIGKVYNTNGVEGDNYWWNRWWYGTVGLNPVTDPLANTPLSINTNSFAVFLRN